MGNELIISKIKNTSFAIKRRLLELGFISGRKVKVVRRSISGNTILVEIEGYILSMRCSVASMVMVI